MTPQCAYCDQPSTRHEPFGDEECCEQCFNILIGGDPDDRPWRCGNE